MSRLRDNVERWLIHENYDFNQAKSENTIFKITINNSDGLGMIQKCLSQKIRKISWS